MVIIMADFSIISDASTALIKLLQANLCPDLISSNEAISLVAPNDKNGDFQLGMFMYDMQEINEYRSSAPIRRGDNTMTFPDKAFTLSYMLFINSNAQIASGAETEQRIFGRTIQTLMDNPNIRLSMAQPYSENEGDSIFLSILNPSYEDKNRIWTSFSMPYQMAIYINVAPVVISSRRSEKFVRVTDATFTSNQIIKN